MSKAEQLYLLIALVGVALTLAWSPTRQMLMTIFSAILTPTVLEALKNVFLWVFWALKMILASHKAWLTHLITPRHIMYPSLQRDKQVSRNLRQ